MRRIAIVAGLLVLAAVSVAGATAHEGSSRNTFVAHLNGYHEVPAISTSGTGTLTLKVAPPDTTISYTLTYSGLTSSATGAHIHFAQPDVNGAVVVFLCGGGGKPPCPAGGGTVSGTITAADVLGVPAQGITAGDLGAVLRALRAGLTYTNVHSSNHPGGEIRGQLRAHGENN